MDTYGMAKLCGHSDIGTRESIKVIAELEVILQDAIQAMNSTLTPEQKKIKVQGAIYDGEVLAAPGVEELSRMPTREQLFARLAGAFQAPTQKFASVVYQINARFASVLSAVQTKREKEGGEDA